jgi:uncharacterized protein with LGFP repeats/GH25 family lysozyme M1 (1,4-beta-N-acetylmuramidase)
VATSGLLRLTVGTLAAALIAVVLPSTSAPAAPAKAPHDTDTPMGSTIAAHEPDAAPKRMTTLSALAPAGVPGIDVSHWQGQMDWNAWAANGTKWAYIKATESNWFIDGQFQNNAAGAYNAGLIRGAYHFAAPNETSGAVQADYFFAHGANWTPDGRTLPPVLDIEYARAPLDMCYGISQSQMVAWVEDFVNRMHQLTGRWPVVYTTRNWWRACTGNYAGLGPRSPLWIAGYQGNPINLPYGWPGWTMWQYSSTPLDQDSFNGTEAELRALATGSDDEAIAAHYAKLGGAGNLGDPAGARYAVPGGVAQDYTNGTIYLSPGTRAWSVRGDIRAFYQAYGGPGSLMGFPGMDEAVGSYGNARYVHFQAASIYSVPNIGVFEVHGAIREQYGSLGWENSVLGYPITNEMDGGDGVGRFNGFQAGAIYWSPSSGAYELHGDIWARWAQLDAQRGFLKYPTTNQTTRDNIGAFNHFQGGSLYWSPGTGTHWVVNGIRAVYLSLDAERSFLGYPTSDETSRDNVGTFNHFQHGSLFWSPSSGIHYVINAIWGKYASYDYEKSFLGYPTTNETSRDNYGTFNHFEHGSIFWSPAGGIHSVVNGIRAVYLSYDAERSFLGYPTSDETSRDNVGTFNHFQYGSIFWSPAGGIHYVVNGIRARYLALNAELSYLGYPISNEYAIPGGARSDFQHGSITWNAATGQITDRPY